jgi:alanine-glyoxylate transaminase/serine-glyoxylate transaminase/serine-pyruvate transaminase
MGAILERLGAQVQHVAAARLGEVPDLDAVGQALRGAKLVSVTHVDTSTGVRAPVAEVARLAREQGALVVVDGVCSVGGEALRQDEWGVDVVLTGSQKALGAPPGLALVMFGARAMAAWRGKKAKVPSLYLDLAEWLPIMESYERGAPQYFATPAVNLLLALDVSLGQLCAEGMDARFARHARQAAAFRAAWRAMGLTLLPARDEIAANTLSAVYYPDGVDAALVGRARAEGVALAGGLHPSAKARYFRVGHMGSTRAAEVLATVGAVERALMASGHRLDPGAGLAAAQATLVSSS